MSNYFLLFWLILFFMHWRTSYELCPENCTTCSRNSPFECLTCAIDKIKIMNSNTSKLGICATFDSIIIYCGKL